MIRTNVSTDGIPQVVVREVEEYIASKAGFFDQQGFYEWEVARRTEIFGNVATYSAHTKRGSILATHHKTGSVQARHQQHGGFESFREVVMKPVRETVWQRFAVAILLFLAALILSPTALSNDLMTARVVGVADGDNITVLTSLNKQIKIRLYGIDCPEEGQSFGMQAKEFTSGQCFGMTIQYRLMGIDRFDRTVAIVFLEDGEELNLEILKAGLAWHSEHYAKRQDYVDAEAEARKSGIGLWADPDPTPPWDWRRNRR